MNLSIVIYGHSKPYSSTALSFDQKLGSNRLSAVPFAILSGVAGAPTSKL